MRSFLTIQHPADDASDKYFLYYCNNKNNGTLSSISKIKTKVYKKSNARQSIPKTLVQPHVYLILFYCFDNCITDLLLYISLQNIESCSNNPQKFYCFPFIFISISRRKIFGRIFKFIKDHYFLTICRINGIFKLFLGCV